jgi:leucyl aminopeptidase
MPLTASLPVIALSAASPADVDTDFFAVPIFDGDETAGDLRALDAATGGAFMRAQESRELQGRLYETLVTPVTNGWRAARIAFIGAGKRKEFNAERLRRVAAAAALAARQRRVQRMAWLNRGDVPLLAAVQAATEGVALSAFSPDRYKSGERGAPPLEEALIVAASVEEPSELEAAIERGRILGESSNIARELSNEPSNVLTPTIFAERAAEICAAAGIAVDVLGEREIRDLGMGLLLGVARGSAEPPRVIVMRHSPPGAPQSPVLGLIGKGITFDTGGISIKPAEGMERMKDDMAGGAAVVCAMRAIGLLKAPINVIGIVPTTENMPGGRALKPGDVLTSASGKTVEVINTDAEGRLVLADAVTYVQRNFKPATVIDLATLTGAILVSLGHEWAGLFSNNDELAGELLKVGADSGDKLWRMPLAEPFDRLIDSPIADMKNVGPREGGSITAAQFIQRFIENGVKWAHIDMAGKAWADKASATADKGATGFGVRLLDEYVSDVLEK